MFLVFGAVAVPLAAPALADTRGAEVWISEVEIDALPTSGAAWEHVRAAADSDLTGGVLTQRDDHNARTLAAALVAARLDSAAYRTKVRASLGQVVATPYDTNDVLAAARRLGTYVVAADVAGLDAFDPAFDTVFRSWVRSVLAHRFAGGGGGGTIAEVHERRPNNFGTHAAFSRIAAAVYLGDGAEVARAAQVFRGWLGDRAAFNGFNYGSLSWQADVTHPVGVNPAGATIGGHDVDGVLPDDQRRGGEFTWPPPCENYVRGALQGAVATAEVLDRAGYTAWEWQDRALFRAVRWLHTHPSSCSFTGDDAWQAWVVNRAYDTDFPSAVDAGAGKNMAWAAWTHGPGRTVDAAPRTSPSSSPSTSGLFIDDDGSTHEPGIEAIAGAGLASGCAPQRFCPSTPLSRGQMATMLANALRLPPATSDHFVDDAGGVHEAAANRLAEAGIARGTAPGRFEPAARLTRAQMASLLAAAFAVAPSTLDRFSDDEGLVHEAAIDALAATGIASGCGSDGARYCPSSALRRDQMATLLSAARARLAA